MLVLLSFNRWTFSPTKGLKDSQYMMPKSGSRAPEFGNYVSKFVDTKRKIWEADIRMLSHPKALKLSCNDTRSRCDGCIVCNDVPLQLLFAQLSQQGHSRPCSRILGTPSSCQFHRLNCCPRKDNHQLFWCWIQQIKRGHVTKRLTAEGLFCCVAPAFVTPFSKTPVWGSQYQVAAIAVLFRKH